MIHCSGIFGGKINIESTSKNIKCGNIKEKPGNLTASTPWLSRSEERRVDSSEISTYEKMYFELKNVQNVLGILLKTIIKIRNNHF